MILTRLHGHFYGRVTEAVTWGFLFILLHFVCLPTPPCTVQARQVCCAIWTWWAIACLAGCSRGLAWPWARGSGAGGATVHSLLASSVLLDQNLHELEIPVFQGSLDRKSWGELLKAQRMDFSKLWRSPTGRGDNLIWQELCVRVLWNDHTGPQLPIWLVQLANTSYRSSDLVGEQVLKALIKNNYENINMLVLFKEL